MKLKGKVAFITGGAAGIGKEIALTLARQGADCVICDVNEQLLAETAAEIKALGVESMPLVLNVCSMADCEAAVNKIIDKFKKVDILINNAGITRDGLLIRMKEADWDAVISVNLKGAFNCTKAVVKPMMKQRSGAIVNMASIIGLMGNAGQVNYAASKAGLIGLTKSVAKEVASRNIRVNAIAPGFIETKMTQILSDDVKQAMLNQIPLGKFGSPQDVANLVVFLVTDDSNYITGQVISINGGMLM
ncbi:MAG: 3-oxoacyl-[acyl-carrier-protein] reductase [Candidatus Omnitrophica bacterium]|nr:3-oxoacyl-[acyl-carrier-protein] reductase [Candidatus Omnitrophota bacterium]